MGKEETQFKRYCHVEQTLWWTNGGKDGEADSQKEKKKKKHKRNNIFWKYPLKTTDFSKWTHIHHQHYLMMKQWPSLTLVWIEVSVCYKYRPSHSSAEPLGSNCCTTGPKSCKGNSWNQEAHTLKTYTMTHTNSVYCSLVHTFAYSRNFACDIFSLPAV